MFEPFRCESCVHGTHNYGEDYEDDCFSCVYEYDWRDDVEQCEQYYEDDEEIAT